MRLFAENRVKILRYLVVTAQSAAITLGLPIFLHEIIGLSEETAVALAFGIAFLVNFFLLKSWVFKPQSGKNHFMRFVLSSLAFRGGEYCAFLLLFNIIHLNYIVAIVLVLAVSLILKFLVQKKFVFAP